MNFIKEEMFGRDLKVKKTIEMAKIASSNDEPVLIVGEAGIGKESLGRFIHQISKRSISPFLLVDCAKGDEEVENEILGHRDETTARFQKGILERSNGGTVLLKNIDGLKEEFQKKMHKIFNELLDYDINIKIIATTSKNLSKLVGAGRFSRALYLYLANCQLQLNPLRERIEDIQFLAEQYLNERALELQIERPKIEMEAMEKLKDYYWTHNVIELKSVMEKSLDFNHDGPIKIEDLAIGERKIMINSFGSDEDGMKLMSLKEAEKLLIRKALIHTSENRTQAAKILGVSIRTLRNKINEYRSDGSNYFVNLR
jgi:two-component system response regulator FlrC